MGIAAVGLSTRTLRRVSRIARETRERGGVLFDNPGIRAKIARLEVELWALRVANYRTVAAAQKGNAPGPESSILKIRGSEILQRCFELGMEVMGQNSFSWWNEPGVIPALEESIASSFHYTRASSIYGGSNEIQKNVIAKLILGLPSA
jgi:alkylation response protein AidB-like acyl-CoA dehydrogenase